MSLALVFKTGIATQASTKWMPNPYKLAMRWTSNAETKKKTIRKQT